MPIRPTDELLVPIGIADSYPFYAQEMQITEPAPLYVREQVSERFDFAKQLLARRGIRLVAFDGWRSVELQEKLYWTYMKLFALSPGLESVFADAVIPCAIRSAFELLDQSTQQILHKQNRQYVSWPSIDPLCPSPHLTGGAVDVWLYNGEQKNRPWRTV